MDSMDLGSLDSLECHGCGWVPYFELELDLELEGDLKTQPNTAPTPTPTMQEQEFCIEQEYPVHVLVPPNIQTRTKHVEETTETSSVRKRVQFDSVEIREYPIVLGDNPACSGGA